MADNDIPPNENTQFVFDKLKSSSISSVVVKDIERLPRFAGAINQGKFKRHLKYLTDNRLAKLEFGERAKLVPDINYYEAVRFASLIEWERNVKEQYAQEAEKKQLDLRSVRRSAWWIKYSPFVTIAAVVISSGSLVISGLQLRAKYQSDEQDALDAQVLQLTSEEVMKLKSLLQIATLRLDSLSVVAKELAPKASISDSDTVSRLSH